MTDMAAEVDTDGAPASLPEAEKVVRGFVNEGLVPGAMISWGFSGGPVRHYAAGELGFGINRAIDDHSIFRIFSQTKPITGIAAMMLIEDGTIALDQPLGEILPDFADMWVMIAENPEDTRPAAHSITIRHLLTHTAGFGMSSMTLGPLYLKHGIVPGSHGRVAGPDELPTPASLAEMGARLAKLPLAADPGTRFDYSVALDVLGLVIEVASGIPFDAFLQQRLFGPLGMVDTGFSIAPAQVDRFVALHRRDGATFSLADDPANSLYARGFYPAGGGGLVSTAHDYARFASMLLAEGELDGVQVLKPQTVRLARSNLLPQGIDRVDLPTGQTLSGVGFGAAMSVSLRPGKRTGGAFDWPGDVPAGVFGWPGAAGTACWIDPERQFFLLFLTQYWPSWLNGSMRPDVIAAAYRDLASQA